MIARKSAYLLEIVVPQALSSQALPYSPLFLTQRVTLLYKHQQNPASVERHRDTNLQDLYKKKKALKNLKLKREDAFFPAHSATQADKTNTNKHRKRKRATDRKVKRERLK